MFSKFHTGDTSACHCRTADMTVEHLLQHCPLHQNLRAETWPADTPVQEMFGPVRCLRLTESYIRGTGVPVWANDDEEEDRSKRGWRIPRISRIRGDANERFLNVTPEPSTVYKIIHRRLTCRSSRCTSKRRHSLETGLMLSKIPLIRRDA